MFYIIFTRWDVWKYEAANSINTSFLFLPFHGPLILYNRKKCERSEQPSRFQSNCFIIDIFIAISLLQSFKFQTHSIQSREEKKYVENETHDLRHATIERAKSACNHKVDLNEKVVIWKIPSGKRAREREKNRFKFVWKHFS